MRGRPQETLRGHVPHWKTPHSDAVQMLIGLQQAWFGR
jgi:hypothetical protein